MRRLTRHALPKALANYLTKKQAEVDDGRPARPLWKDARQTKTMEKVAGVLRQMVGRRARCMFCEDSRGTDMEHFKPLAKYPESSFVWENLLWICTPCNRLKGDRLEFDGAGRPLLIDPTREEPWTFLYFDSLTDQVTARYDASTETYDPRGAHTSDSAVLSLNVQAVTDGRGATRRNLERAVRSFLGAVTQGIARDEALGELHSALDDNSGYGLLRWYFLFDGQGDEPFSSLKSVFPKEFETIAASIDRGVAA